MVKKSNRPAPALLALCWAAAWGGAGLARQPGDTPAAPAVSAHPVNPLSPKPDWEALREFDGAITRDQFEREIRDVYLERDRFPVPWIAGTDSVKIETGEPDQPQVEVRFAPRGAPPATPPRFWKTAAELPPLKGRPVLSDLHIAIDPGHIGGAYAMMEERHLSFKPGEAIQEGDLSLLTALVLEKRLKALGATVTLVRRDSNPVTSSRPEDFRTMAVDLLKAGGHGNPRESYEGVFGQARLLTVQWQSEKLFYRVGEIQARASRVNQEIKPDLVLALHYNAEAWGSATSPQFSPANHFHLLINGCYSPGELLYQDTRWELLARVFSGIHAEELALADAVAPAVARATGLPPYTYETPNARPMGASGFVWARNLLANRIYRCPVLYFEPYVMNHEQTYRRLLLGHWIGRTLVGEELVTSPVEDYVRGIVDGLAAYYQTARRA